ncbi:MAG: LysM domain-containing protein [Pseudomonadota bacterium]
MPLTTVARSTLLLMLSAMPGAAQTVVVQPGDTLAVIAARELGAASRWREICALNADVISNCNRISAGWELRLPVDAAPAIAAPVPADEDPVESIPEPAVEEPEAPEPQEVPDAPESDVAPDEIEAPAIKPAAEPAAPAPDATPSPEPTTVAPGQPTEPPAPAESEPAQDPDPQPVADPAPAPEPQEPQEPDAPEQRIYDVPFKLPLRFEAPIDYIVARGANGGLLMGGHLPGELTSNPPGIHLRLADDFEQEASGRIVRVAVNARSAVETTARVMYSTAEVGDSGWQDMAARPGGAVTEFTYAVPPLETGGGDFIGILPDPEDAGNLIEVLSVTVSIE